VGIAAGAAASVIAYAALRVLERALFPEPNPAALIWSDQSAFVWRSAMALYLGGAGVFAGVGMALRAPRAAGRGILALVAVAVAAILAQGALCP
jgi:hypothetical protein